ncbi:MAG: hypothetical protein C4320_05965, partial [Armatimonadota bacterium]
ASKLEPWSEYLTNRQGTAPNPSYDPLQFCLDEAHRRGLEVHCWFNPYRAKHPAQKGPLAANHLAVTNPEVVKSYGRYLWMDPGEPLVQRRSREVMLDVVRRYDVDGIHIDDYFYPYAEKDAVGKPIPFPDEPSYRRYRSGGGKLGKDDWRRKNVDDFVQTTYQAIKGAKPWVKFGISPFGIYRPGVPAGIQAGVDQYADLYADVQKWIREGWCDYLSPQLYWPIAQKPQSFPVLLDYWLAQNSQGRHIWPGQYTSRTLPEEGKWDSRELMDQIAILRQKGAGGSAHFSMKAFLLNAKGVRTALTFGPYREPAAIPASPWLGAEVPPAPTITEISRTPEGVRLKAGVPDEVRFIAWSKAASLNADAKIWSEWHLTSNRTLGIPLLAGDGAIAVASVSRTGIWSPVTLAAVPTAARAAGASRGKSSRR